MTAEPGNTIPAAASGEDGAGVRARLAQNFGQSIKQPKQRRGFVRFMKFVLPLCAVALVGVMAAWPQLTRREGGFRLSYSSIETQELALVMNNPRFRGIDGKGQPYVVTADRAVQDADDAKQVTMDNVAADIALTDGGWLSLTAKTGLYHDVSKLLTLHGDINVFGDRGYEFHGLVAEVDLNAGTVASDDKVWGHTGLGAIRANGIRVYDKGKTIVFINGVKTTLHPRGQSG
ncbi:LPS export ABC transporter periplasmic protein LptC [Ferrovibrio sp.]|uniref:LPS export ABC transporter periplasmic protein LptC n=1 Tax=Ferrovibrio sp. TaxID=1917215 RepID=UPI0025C01C59|nr:LPS export ABC transporter periplasmic protein LptC [Ferrovibrio sp.]MBX3454562.1 LPS export ABC transporter periplasmic protein LptC [Ferrovibrio sp.]